MKEDNNLMNNFCFFKGALLNPSFDYHDNLVIIDAQSGILGRLEKNGKCIEPISFLGLDSFGYSKYTDVVEYNNSFFLIPRNVTKTPEIVITNGLVIQDRISLKPYNIKPGLEKYALFSFALRINNYAFFFGYSYPTIVRFNIDDYTIDYIDEWNKNIITADDSKMGYFNTSHIEIVDDELLLPLCCDSAILKLNIKTLNFEIIRISIYSEGISCISQIDDSDFLISGAGTKSNWIYLWNAKRNEIIHCNEILAEENGMSIKYILIAEDNNAYLFPWQSIGKTEIGIYKYDLKTFKVEKSQIPTTYMMSDEQNRENGYEFIYACWKKKNELLYITGRDMMWHEYNIVTNMHLSYPVLYDVKNHVGKSVMEKYFENLVKVNYTFKENDMSMEDFIRFL